MDRLPDVLMELLVQFSDGVSLRAIACTARRIGAATDKIDLWRAAAMAAHPHLRRTQDVSPYQGDWKALVCDQNRLNRSAVHMWIIPQIRGKRVRIRSPMFTVAGYQFTMIVDPRGNPHIHSPDPMLSVYLECHPSPQRPRSSTLVGQNTWDWDCPCEFSFRLKRRVDGKTRSLVWKSGAHAFTDRTSTWGVHALVKREQLINPDAGFLAEDGSISIEIVLILN